MTHPYIPVTEAATREGWKSTVSNMDARFLRRMYDKMRLGIPDGICMDHEEAQRLTETVQIAHASHSTGLNLQNLLLLDWDEFTSDVFKVAKYTNPDTGRIPNNIHLKCGFLTPTQAGYVSIFQVKIAELERDRAKLERDRDKLEGEKQDLAEAVQLVRKANHELRNMTRRLKHAADKMSTPSHFKLSERSEWWKTAYGAITGVTPERASPLARFRVPFYEVNKVERMRKLPPSYVFMVPDADCEGGARCVSFADKKQAQEACKAAKERAGK